MSSQLDKLEQLARLRDNGVLTTEEFDHQKTLILSEASAKSLVDEPVAATMEPGPAIATHESELDQDVYLNVFRPIESALVARTLTKLGVAAAVTVFIDEAVRLGVDVYDARGGALSPEFSNETALAVVGAMMLFWVGLSALLAWRILKTASRSASVGLFVVTLLGALANIPSFLEGGAFRLWALVSGLALLLAVQAMRGAFALRRFPSDN